MPSEPVLVWGEDHKATITEGQFRITRTRANLAINTLQLATGDRGPNDDGDDPDVEFDRTSSGTDKSVVTAYRCPPRGAK